eukprot:TRINITY_DN2631_c0_g1_i1.p1 TRINITY_DN2631_c0_g1~~TRINITY_DN2631_c0_g1_i1.p1  ORF type:complete len:477 (+),score=102.45 TRINITY_DN2631_c0_g1_i1:483-1913(+)
MEKKPLIQDNDYQRGSIQDAIEQPKPSLLIMFVTIFLQSITFTIVLPSLWFYIQELKGDHSFLGYTIAIYSVGQFTGSLIFGKWSNVRPTLEPLIVSLVISLIGNFYYGFARDIPDAKWQVFIARFLVGFGAGNVSLCRAFVSEASTIEKKTSNMSAAGAAQGIGFVFGPCLGFLVSYVPSFKLGPFHIDGFTSAGFLSGVFALTNVLLLPFTFTDIPSKTQNFTPYQPPMTPKEYPPMITTIVLFFIVITVFSVFETLCTPITNFYYHWQTKLNGILLLAAGMLSVFTFIGLGILSKSKNKLDDRLLLIIGFVFMMLAMVIIIPYPGEKSLYMWQFLLAATLLSIGYPISSALVFSLFAKVINPVGQGTKMGYLTAVGSLARMLGPIWGTYTLKLGTDGLQAQVVFMITAIIVVIGFILILATYKLMVPHPDYDIIDSNIANGITNSVHSFTGSVGSITTPNAEDPRSGLQDIQY